MNRHDEIEFFIFDNRSLIAAALAHYGRDLQKSAAAIRERQQRGVGAGMLASDFESMARNCESARVRIHEIADEYAR